jgi:hypothetical protein
MARPQKLGLDYFPVDVGIHDDNKLVVPIGKFGMQGFGIIVRLMAEVYKKSYFCPWDEMEQYAFANKINVDINLINDVVNECAKWGFFHKRLLAERNILTSHGFQKRYIEAARRRKSITLLDEYVLIDPIVESEEITIILVNADGKTVNVYIKPIKSNAVYTENTQSKVKDIKVNELKKKTSSRQLKTYAEDNPFYLMAAYFHSRLQTFVNKIGKGHLIQNSNMQSWADDFRKIIEIDNRPRAELGEVVTWATSDPFWQQNILSPDKLRKKYTELCLKMVAKNGSANYQNANDKLFEKNKAEAQKIMEAMERAGVRDQDIVLKN